MSKKKHGDRNSFSGSIGFILAAAGSAVGLGNLWRFPYLAAKDGGGLFLFVYLILALTFGFTLLTAEVAIGRKTKQSPLTAYTKVHKKFKFLGVLACLIPVLILPYYCTIGGWVLKYFVAYIIDTPAEIASDGYFGGYLGDEITPIIMTAIFLGLVAFIVIMGVEKGIESFSKIIMPTLILLVVGISIFSLTIKHTDGDVTRTGLEGLKIYLIPDFSDVTFTSFLGVLIDAVGQLFFSLSVAMGIMVTYGSYVKDDADLNKSINHIEIFDTAVAFLAGVMIIPAVYTFSGKEGLSAHGASLMFNSLPNIFNRMGGAGKVIGILFFAMVLFAALTSAVSVLEAIVSSFMDQFHLSRKKATIIETIIALLGGVAVCLGYNKWFFDIKLPNGAHAQILDILDYISNYCLMPIVAIGTCILIGWIVKPKYVIEEVEKSGTKFGRKNLFIIMIKFIAPVLLFAVLLKSTIL